LTETGIGPDPWYSTIVSLKVTLTFKGAGSDATTVAGGKPEPEETGKGVKT
jgi:hypothetical protein